MVIFSKFSWLDKAAPRIAFAIAAIAVLVTQPYFIGFIPGHHGWVSSHYLAILQHSTWDNGFVGYTLINQVGPDESRYLYWNRYPAIGSTIQRLLTLEFNDTLAEKIQAARLFMNVVFILTMAFGYLVLSKLIERRKTAMAIVLVTFSSRFFLLYKDMVFAEQVSILASLVALFAIQRFYENGKTGQLIAIIAVTLSIGRGFPVLPLLLLWCIWECLGYWWSKKETLNTARRLARTSVFVLLFGLSLTGIHTFYNMVVESRITGVSLGETTIVEAATRRGGLQKGFNTAHEERRQWNNFIQQQSRMLRIELFPLPRFIRDRLPVELASPKCATAVCHGAVLAVLAAGIIFILVFHWYRWSAAQRSVAVLLLLYGATWLGMARNLAIFHNYTALYYYGIPLVLYGAIAARLPAKISPLLLVGALALFLANNADTNQRKQRMADRSNWIPENFQRIAENLPGGKIVYYEGGYARFLKRRPYAAGFLLPDNPVTNNRDIADYLITYTKNETEQQLASGNDIVYLYRIHHDQAASE
jgi:hypothetical protein